MTSGITEYEAKIIDLRDGIVRSAMAGQYQDADDMLTAFADEIRAQAAEKAVAWVDNNAQPLTGGSFDRSQYDSLRKVVTEKETP